MIRLVCPFCDKLLGLGSETAGQVTVCPNCGERVRVPDTHSADEPQAPAELSPHPAAPESQHRPISRAPAPGPSTGWQDSRPIDAELRPSRPGRRGHRRRWDHGAGSGARETGRALVGLICAVLGFLLGVNLILAVVLYPSAEDLSEADRQGLTPSQVDAALLFVYTVGLVKQLVITMLYGGLLLGLYFGKNGARIVLGILLLLGTLALILVVALSFMAEEPLNVILLAVLGLQLAVSPIIGVLLFVSRSIQAYCDQ